MAELTFYRGPIDRTDPTITAGSGLIPLDTYRTKTSLQNSRTGKELRIQIVVDDKNKNLAIFVDGILLKDGYNELLEMLDALSIDREWIRIENMDKGRCE